MNIGLGTAQFGLNYGISNTKGKCSSEEVAKILRNAHEMGITTIDTSPLYGTSEEVLGENLPDDHTFKIITKTPKFPGHEINDKAIKELEETFFMSLSKMNQSEIYGLLIHDCDDLLVKDGRKLIDKMIDLKDRGLVSKIGASIYDYKQIDYLLDNFLIDLIQIPINVFDQRLLESGYLLKIKEAGVEIHARSIFMQGLLLMESDNLPVFFDSIKGPLNCYRKFLDDNNLSPVEAALSFVKSIREIDIILCGVCSLFQLNEIIEAYSICNNYENWGRFGLKDNKILNPSRWKL